MESTFPHPSPADSSDSEISSNDDSQVSPIYGWVPHPAYPIAMRKRWAIFAVAKILGNYLPLGVICTPRSGRNSYVSFGEKRDDSIFASISRVICALSDQTNRTAIKAELDMAVEYYSSGLAEKLLPATPISLHSDGYKAGAEATETGYSFPFIVSCLLQGAREDMGWAQQLSRWDVLPLSTVYDDRNMEVNAVVLDITDLSDIGYGVVSRTIERISWLPTNKDPFNSQRLGSDIINANGQEQIEDFYPRKPLSMKDFQEKYDDIDLEHADDDFDEATLAHMAAMHSYRVIEIEAAAVVWLETECTAINAAPTMTQRTSLVTQTLIALIAGLADVVEFDPSAFDQARKVDSFQVCLQQVLKEQVLGHISATILAHLIAMAFEGHTELILTRFKGLSTEALLLCLQKEELRSVRSVAFCLRTMTLPLDGIEKMVSIPGSAIKEVFVLDTPNSIAQSESDAETPYLVAAIAELLLAAESGAEPLPQLRVSSAYSAALQRRRWFPLSSYEVCSSMTAARVRHLLVSVQFGRFDHYQVDNVLLSPVAMVTRLLHWLRTDDYQHLCGFSCGPLTLSEELNGRIGPMPIVDYFDYEHEERKFRDALHDGWILNARLIKFEGTNWSGTWEGTRVAYGFIRWHPEKEDVLQVLSAREYLAISAPEFEDDEILSRKLSEAAKAIGKWEDQPDSCVRGEWLTDLKAFNGCSLEVFLASFVEIIE